LFDLEEVETYKTDPNNADTDGDGIMDGTEVSEGTDPLLPQEETGDGNLPPVEEEKDTDGDGLTDNEEAQYRTDVLSRDTDDDGLNDYQEIKTYKTNPLKADTDGDGYVDGLEVKNGFNPLGEGKLNL
jgi:hypothetical protein